MEEEQNAGLGIPDFAPPTQISLSPFPPSMSPSPRRLSSNFIPRSQPLKAQRQLSWISLQGRLIGADEASSSRTIGGGLTPEQAVAWDLFSPIHRVLIVAIIAVAAAESEKNKHIIRLIKSVQLRDQVLSSMQEKLDNLCKQVNYFNDQPETGPAFLSSHKTKYLSCGCCPCDQHGLPSNDSDNVQDLNAYNADEMFKYKLKLSKEEQQQQPEERRMSDLSDWAPSVSSSADIQLSMLANEYDIYNLQRECEEKDATIKELSTFIHSSELVGSKRIAELEDMVRRKNMIITKLKKDMVILEQKVMQLTRLRRPSFSTSRSSETKLPLMADNLLYDMDSTTSPSSSDSDSSSSKNRPPLPPISKVKEIPFPNSSSVVKKQDKAVNTSSIKSSHRPQKSLSVTPLQEKSMNQNQPPSVGRDLNRRRHGPHKRWT